MHIILFLPSIIIPNGTVKSYRETVKKRNYEFFASNDQTRQAKKKNNNINQKFTKISFCGEDCFAYAINVIISLYTRLSHGNKLTINIKRTTQIIFKWTEIRWKKIYIRIRVTQKCINKRYVHSYCNTFLFRFFSIQFEQLIMWALMLLPNFSTSININIERGKKTRDEKNYKNN